MITDLKPTSPTRSALPTKLWAWMGGTERPPLESYPAMLEVLFDKARKRSNHE